MTKRVNTPGALPETVRYVMVGGGRRSFMGAIHRSAAVKVEGLEIAGGAFCTSLEDSRALGAELGVRPDMVFWNYRKLLKKCAALPPAARVSFVSVVTPNALHYPVAMSALDCGIPALVEKPLACTLDEAANLEWKHRKSGVPLCVAMPYRAYSMLRTAKGLIDSGEIGPVRRFAASMLSPWMARRIENQGSRGALWRTDAHMNGGGGIIMECVPHLQHVLEWLAGLEITEVAADGYAVVPGRILPDECNVLVRTEQGVRGAFLMSRVAVGHREGLAFEITGEKASIRWCQAAPAVMRLDRADGTSRMISDGTPSGVSAAYGTPYGANPAYIEALSAVYAQFAMELATGRKPAPEERIGLSPAEGVRSAAVSDAVLRSIAPSLPAIAAGESSVLSTSREIYAARDDSRSPKWTAVSKPAPRG